MMYDDDIMRTIIDLPDAQANALADWCKAEKVSKAEAVRRALASMLANQQHAGREKAFGAWGRKNLNARTFVENLREEWER